MRVGDTSWLLSEGRMLNIPSVSQIPVFYGPSIVRSSRLSQPASRWNRTANIKLKKKNQKKMTKEKDETRQRPMIKRIRHRRSQRHMMPVFDLCPAGASPVRLCPGHRAGGWMPLWGGGFFAVPSKARHQIRSCDQIDNDKILFWAMIRCAQKVWGPEWCAQP